MGCDFVSDMNLNKVLHLFREKSASVAMLLTTRKDIPELPVPSAKAKTESCKLIMMMMMMMIKMMMMMMIKMMMMMMMMMICA
jgi:hypothetical protein